MASPTEDDHFRPGIAALQASRANDAQAHFQAAIDAGLATTKSWLGLQKQRRMETGQELPELLQRAMRWTLAP